MQNVPTSPLHRIRPGRLACLLALGLLFGSLQACAVPQRQHLTRSYETPARPTSGGLPAWANEPLSWAKLDTIESWLENAGTGASPFWRVEAELQLAEGRLSFADPLTHAGEQTQRQRRRNARLGFLRIRANPKASAEQYQRASEGLKRAATAGNPLEASSKLAGVLSRSEWGARRPNMQRITRANSPWRFITLHHSALEGAPTIGTRKQEAISALRIVQRSQMDGRGWGDIGYHFLIDPAGRIWQGRELRYQGAHAGGKDGRNNVGNVGVCLLGNFDEARPTSAALSSLDTLVDELCRRYSIPRSGIVGHTDWKATVCPGRYLLPHVRRLAR